MDRSRTLSIGLPLAVVVLALVISVILVQARPQVEKQEAERPAIRVRVIEAVSDDVRLAVTSQGTVEPSRRSTIVAQVAGRVVATGPRFDEGGFVSSGELLVRMESTDYSLAVTQARAALEQARVRLAREEAESAIARQEWSELGRGAPSPLVLREPQLAEARAAVAAAQAAIEQATLNLSRTTIRAPYEGRVLRTMVDVGQFVAPGTPVAELYATDYAEVVLMVPSDDLAFIDLDSIRDGKPSTSPAVTLRADFAGREQAWEGRIVRTTGSIDPRSRMLGLIARVDRPFRIDVKGREPMNVGMFVKGEIEGRVVENVMVLPREALRGKSELLIAKPDDTLEIRTVDLLRTTRDSVVVRSGLSAGERVIISPVETPVSGMKLAVVTDSSSGVTVGADSMQLVESPGE